MKHLTYYLLALSMLIFASCNNTPPVRECPTFTELPDPTADTASDWSAVKQGLNASFGSIDVRYPKSVAPAINTTNKHSVSGWRGERVSAQMVLWASEEMKQTEFSFGDFKSAQAQLPADIAQARFVRYIMTDAFAEGCGHRKPENYPSSLSPDMLDNVTCFDVEPRTTRPVWLTVDIPANAEAGVYTTQIKVTAQNQKPQTFELQVEVLPQTLPPASEWAYYLDLWQHPSTVARIHNLEPWSDEHFDAIRPYMQMLASAGQKVITANLNKDPWNVQTQDPYLNMITWTLKADGSWVYDYAIFDRWVEFMMDLGVKTHINCYSMAPWNNELIYFDEKKNEEITIVADPLKPIFAEIWTPFLLDFVKHLDAKGWTTFTNIAMDERAPEIMRATLGLIEKVAPQLGVAFADNHKSYKEYPNVKDLCIAYEADMAPADLAYRKENGLITTYYVCCSHAFPNAFTFSAPAESAYMAWHTVACNFDGFLRWAYNSWVSEPLTDSRFRTWPAGDTYVVYPDARSSIRFERLIEGIQDAEKIRILRDQWMKDATPEAMEKLNKLNAQIAKFSRNDVPTEPCHELLNPAKLLLTELSK